MPWLDPVKKTQNVIHVLTACNKFAHARQICAPHGYQPVGLRGEHGVTLPRGQTRWEVMPWLDPVLLACVLHMDIKPSNVLLNLAERGDGVTSPVARHGGR